MTCEMSVYFEASRNHTTNDIVRLFLLSHDKRMKYFRIQQN